MQQTWRGGPGKDLGDQSRHPASLLPCCRTAILVCLFILDIRVSRICTVP